MSLIFLMEMGCECEGLADGQALTGCDRPGPKGVSCMWDGAALT